MQVAIVGFGIAGASTLIQLSKQFDFKTGTDQVDVYETRTRLGAGAPYAEDDDATVINSFPCSLSLDDDNQEDFIEWTKTHYPTINLENTFVARTIYGEYVEAYLKPYLAQDFVRHISARVTDFQVVDADGKPVYQRPLTDELLYRVFTGENGWSKIYDAVFFAIGHPPYQDPYQLDGQANYIQDPYPLKDKLQVTKGKAKIGIVGSGLTTIDLINYCNKYKLFEEQAVTIYFRNEPFRSVIQPNTKENFSQSIDDAWIDRQRADNGGAIPIQLVINQVKADLKANGINYSRVWANFNTGSLATVSKAIRHDDEDYRRFQGFFRAFYPTLHRLMGALDAVGKDYFYHNLGPFFRMLYTQAPATSIRMILDLVSQGKLKLVSGLTDITSLENGQFHLYANGIRHKADLLINATGFNSRLSQAQATDPLLANLIRRNVILSDKRDNILASYPSATPLNPNYQVLDKVYFLGSWIASTQGPNTSVALTKKQANIAVVDFQHQVRRIK
ncbi:FAD/NAD(P)-binding protein [Aerococcaceae bacterium 50-4]